MTYKKSFQCFLLHSILFFHIPAFSESILFAQNTFDLRALNDFLFTSSDTSSETQNDSKYSRSKFGHGWKDFDRDCQNSRHETLIAQSLSSVAFKTYKNCKVVSGEWNSPFSNERIFLASKIDIDHVVPLKWAWERGAINWSKTKRVNFANDPINLLAVEARLNRQKGAKGPYNWLPPKNKCSYLKTFSEIVDTYDLQYREDEQGNIDSLKKRYCQYVK
jgi:hypothetical protein